MGTEISVVIPAVNEAAALPECVAHLSNLPGEILVVTAPSTDQTEKVATNLNCRIVPFAQPHRARQMNLGAAQAKGRILLFLHADTLFPPAGFAKILTAIDRRHAVGGAFSRRYRSPSRVLALTSRLATVRNRLFGWHLGDQAIFVRRDLFEKLGGYRDLPIFEDLDFSRRLRSLGKTVTLTPPVRTSARRFAAHGPWRTTWNDLRLTLKYFRGADPIELCQRRPPDLKPLHAYEPLS